MNWFTKVVSGRGTSGERGQSQLPPPPQKLQVSKQAGWRKSLVAIGLAAAAAAAAALLAPASASAQVATNAIALSNQVVTPYGTPAPNAAVRICLIGATGSPCSTAGVILYSDPNLSYVTSNPIATDQYGNYKVFVVAGAYMLQVTPAGAAGPTYTYYYIGTSATAGTSGFPITLGSTAIASGSTTTALTGLSVNGVLLTTADGATTYLNGAGAYTTPAGGSVTGGTAGQIALFGSATTINGGVAIGNTGSMIPQLASGLLASSVIPWTTPGAIGTGTASTGAFTTLSTTGIAALGASSTIGGTAVCLVTGTNCPTATNPLSGLTAGQVIIAGSATTATSSIALGTSGSDIPQLSSGLLASGVVPWATPGTIGSTTPSTGAFTTITASGGITSSGSTRGLTVLAGTAASGAAGSVVYASDATNGYGEINENNTGLSRICTVANGVCLASLGTMAYENSNAISTTGGTIGGSTSINSTGSFIMTPASGSYSFSMSNSAIGFTGRVDLSTGLNLDQLGTATSGGNFNSVNAQWLGNYWTGSASAFDFWTATNVLGTGSNPTSTLTFAHAGSSGVASVSMPALAVTGLTGYMQANGSGNVTASTTIPSTAITGLGTMATQNANAVDITGGTGLFGNLAVNATFELIATTSATSSANVNPPEDELVGQYWSGASSQGDFWTIQEILGTGANPTSELAFTHFGSTGASNISFPSIVSMPALSVAGSQNITGIQGTAGAKLTAATGTFTSGNLRSTDASGDEIDSGVSSTIPTFNGPVSSSSSNGLVVQANLATLHESAGVAYIDSFGPSATVAGSFNFLCVSSDASILTSCLQSDSAGDWTIPGSLTVGSLTLNGGTDVVYVCSGGTFAGLLSTSSAACTGGSGTATSLTIN